MFHKFLVKLQEHKDKNVTLDRISLHYGKARGYEEILILFPCWFLTSLATYVLLVGRNINLGHFITLGGVLWLSLVLMYCHWAWMPSRSALHNELKSILKKHSDMHGPEFSQKCITLTLKKHLVEIKIKILLHQKDFHQLWHDEIENLPKSKSIFNVGSIKNVLLSYS